MANKSSFEEKTALQKLQLEEYWLQAARTTFRARPIEDYLQLTFAENANPNDTVDVIRQFYLCVKKGITPPASLLMTVANGFEKYNLAAGDLSLDESFTEKRKGKKHPLRQKLKDEEKGRVFYFMWCQIKLAELENKPLTILGAAGIARDKFMPQITTDTLEKEYISAKVSEKFNQAFDVVAEYAPEKKIDMLTWKRQKV